MTAAKVNEVLPADAGELDKIHGYAPEDLKYATYDADERILQGQITRDKLEWYIGRKSINRLGCYGCHDLPGFETAKPVGTALNDWGAKTPNGWRSRTPTFTCARTTTSWTPATPPTIRISRPPIGRR